MHHWSGGRKVRKPPRGRRKRIESVSRDRALSFYRQGRDFLPALQEIARRDLMRYKLSGIAERVEILASQDSCQSCLQLTGRVLMVDEALEQMPIPNKQCTFELSKGKPGWCRCIYLPTLDTTSFDASFDQGSRTSLALQ